MSFACYALGGPGACTPGEFWKMYTFGDAFSLILRAKSRVFRTDYDQVTGNKVMMNWSVDCFHCLLIFS